MAAKQFDTYRIQYFSGLQQLTCSISLLSGGTAVGRVNFFSEGSPLGRNRVRNGISVINYPQSRFSDVIDILRNENPLFINVNESLDAGAIQTDQEPIGDLEAE